jgi:hypothetical protein
MAHVICKNCANHFTGNFCPKCGQKSTVEKIDFKYFIKDIPHSIFHIDKGFFYTLKEMFLHPAKALETYLAGQRVKHFKPFAFVIVLSTIATIIIKLCLGAINFELKKTSGSKLILEGFFVNYPSLLIFLLIPILALITWICFKKYGYNYWEHFLINTFLGALLNIFLMLVFIAKLIKFFTADNLSINYTIFIILFMTYYGFAFGFLFAKRIKNRLRITIIITVMNFFLSITYLSALSFSGLMSPWWK